MPQSTGKSYIAAVVQWESERSYLDFHSLLEHIWYVCYFLPWLGTVRIRGSCSCFHSSFSNMPLHRLMCLYWAWMPVEQLVLNMSNKRSNSSVNMKIDKTTMIIMFISYITIAVILKWRENNTKSTTYKLRSPASYHFLGWCICYLPSLPATVKEDLGQTCRFFLSHTTSSLDVFVTCHLCHIKLE